MKKIIFIIICCFAISCSSSENYFDGEVRIYNSFFINGNLTSTDTLSLSVFGIAYISIQDSLLILKKNSQSTFLSIVNLNNYEISENICMNGKGPGEYISFITSEQYKKESEKIYLYTYNSNLSARLLNVSDSWFNDKTIIEDEIRDIHKIKNSFCEGMFFLNNGSVFAKYDVSYIDPRDFIFFPAEYALYSPLGEKEVIKFFGENVPLNPHLPIISTRLYSGFSRIKPDGTQVVDGMFYMDYINFIDLDKKSAYGLKYQEALSYEEIKSLSVEELLAKSKYAYGDLSVTDEYIFGLYLGYNDNTDPDDIISHIRIFDWAGTPLASLKLDRSIISIAFNERLNLLYALDTEEKIFIYDLNEIIDKISGLRLP